jgi:CysZ protein
LRCPVLHGGIPAYRKDGDLFTPILRAFGQLDDPALLLVLVQSVALSALCFGALAAGGYWLVHHYVADQGLLGDLASSVGGLAALVAALYLFVPIAVVIAGLFLTPICRAVERRWYPGLPPAVGANMLSQTWAGLAIALRVSALSVLSLLVSIFIPGPGQVLGWVVTAWALGRGLFAAVAMRRMSRREADQLYIRRRGAVFVQGAALTLGSVVPLLNLLLPVLGPAAMVHLVSGLAPISFTDRTNGVAPGHKRGT